MTITPFAQCSAFVNASLFYETQDDYWRNHTGINIAQNFRQKLTFEKSVIDTKPESVIDTRVIDTQIMPQTNGGAALLEPENQKTQGSLIISPNTKTNTEVKRIKRLKNRKTISDSTHFEYEGAYYEVMTRSKRSNKPFTIYKEIMRRVLDQFSAAFSIHGRLFVQHWVFSVNHFTDDNAEITNLRKCIIQSLARNYGAKQTAYAWAREKESAEQQHYHFFIAVDGQKVWFHEALNKIVKPIIARSQYFTNATFAGFHQVSDKQSFDEMIYHASYLAKTKGKGHRHPRANDFSTSRLNPVKSSDSLN